MIDPSNMLTLVFTCLFIQRSLQVDVKGFDDSILFDISWPGELDQAVLEKDNNIITVTSAHLEKYTCALPEIVENEANDDLPYEGPTPLEYLSLLFAESQSCSFRLESYWTYEICHGRYVRQYHEDREGKKVKLQEYILGQWDEKHLAYMLDKAKEDKHIDTPIPKKKIDNVNLPYFEIVMGNGTLCELNNNKPRETKVLYVCYTYGKHEVYSLKETSTCVYEIIILSPLLCSHPKYKPKDTGVNHITCAPLDGAFAKPYALMKKELEARKREKEEWEMIKRKLKEFDKEETPTKKIDKVEDKPVDTEPVKNFLLGKTCLTGGTGWWKFEFCYGKTVEQYHIEKDGTRISIRLGVFDLEKHLDWLKTHPYKRPKPVKQRKQMSHFYSDGTICDKTGKPRQTEVKLKCLEKAHSISEVALYLLEPRYCEYILGVESPLICDILPLADENGLVSVEEEEEVLEKDATVSNVNI